MALSRIKLLLGALLLTGATPAPPATPSPVDMLRDAMRAPQHISYEGEVQVLRIGTQRSRVEIYRIEHRAPGMTRRWYSAPQALYGDSVITRGSTTYSVDVKRQRLVVTSGDDTDQQVAARGNFGILLANYDAVYAPGTATIDGRPTIVVLLNNKYTGQTAMRVHIDAKTHLILERQQFAPNGSVIAQMRFEQLRYTNAIPAEVFELPAGLARVDETHGDESMDVAHAISTAGFPALEPKYLPEGFRPIAGDVATIKSVPTLHLLYSDGIRTFSFFQNERDAAIDLSHFRAAATNVANHPAQYVEDGPTTLLAWSDGNRHFALVGDLSLSELERIGASVLP
ncbi:MAG TPA: sigma-E factor regulatory protein RseB domain-containing protein [Candidatus Acidoferrales bacterium]|nr:sigma-E factor regulatory protein RseB domain-containing protein [Candidatus Acidoferrales bacterium]